MSISGVCSPQQCAAVEAKMPVNKPQSVVNPQNVQPAPKPVVDKSAGGLDMSI